MYICTSNSLQPNGLQSTRLLCPGILQARILEWVVISYSRGSSRPRDQTQISDVSCIGKSGSLPLVPPGKPKPLAFLCLCVCVCVKSLRSCPTLCNAMDCSLPGSPDCGIFQARLPEWVAIPFSRGSSQLRKRAKPKPSVGAEVQEGWGHWQRKFYQQLCPFPSRLTCSPPANIF